ncbi:hypothetical protein CYMTET_13753 [Cymbomonas tetramitiformis]|uniref:Uncharacterized protein n=1 Tax=Cymbomonas tetramitiformis TaxID=36881 RepID=A0AAE0LAK0_9CHLO|nr:hypothetical protein CYMTET_13753 [Cymbomonas tetramitiformis]
MACTQSLVGSLCGVTGVHLSPGIHVKSRRRTHKTALGRPRTILVLASDSNPWRSVTPGTAKEAISFGNLAYKNGAYEDAIRLFGAGRKLPGSGVQRDRKLGAELSPGEEQALFYNLACCHSQREELASALSAFEACLTAGYLNWSRTPLSTVRQRYEDMNQCNDLASLRNTPEFEELLSKYNPDLGDELRDGQGKALAGFLWQVLAIVLFYALITF